MTNFAYLIDENPYFELFAPSGRVPIVNILLPNQVELEGSTETEVYMVAVDKLTPKQFHGIAFRIAAAAAVDVRDVRRDMMLKGLPLRASQVRSVSSDSMTFL